MYKFSVLVMSTVPLAEVQYKYSVLVMSTGPLAEVQ
jgi:hypothetical protein